MSSWLRRAGRGRLEDGSVVMWSVAEGGRGRRWREIRRARDGPLITSLLLESDPSGRFAHAELSTAAGLLTLHPEGDGTLHGNVVDGNGVRHVVGLPWTERSVVLLDGSPIAASAAARSLRPRVADGESCDVDGVAIGLGLDVEQLRTAVRRIGNRWVFDRGPAGSIDDDGLPVLDDADGWPLER